LSKWRPLPLTLNPPASAVAGALDRTIVRNRMDAVTLLLFIFFVPLKPGPRRCGKSYSTSSREEITAQ